MTPPNFHNSWASRRSFHVKTFREKNRQSHVSLFASIYIYTHKAGYVCITNIVCYILLPCQWQMVDICAKGFRMLHGWSSSSMCHSVHSVLYCLFKVKFPKYSKHWPYVLEAAKDCGCSKMLDHGLNHGLFLLLQGFCGKIYSRLNWKSRIKI